MTGSRIFFDFIDCMECFALHVIDAVPEDEGMTTTEKMVIGTAGTIAVLGVGWAGKTWLDNRAAGDDGIDGGLHVLDAEAI